MSFNEKKYTEFGEVHNEWSINKLGNFITTLTDYHANGSYEKLKENVELFDDENYAIMIRTTNFEQNNFERSGFKYITKDAYEFLEKSKVFPNDILMNKIANAGSVYLMPNLSKPVSLAMNLFLIRLNENEINQKYGYYFLKNFEPYVKTRASGSVTKTITKDNVRKLEIAFPNIYEQNSIVAILSSLDDKIELNNRINKNLEEMAQAIFKSWFVDFEPFKDKVFEDSELGMIPKGWRVGTLGELMAFCNGNAFKSSTYVQKGDYKIITIKNVQDAFIDTISTNFINSIPYDVNNDCILNIGDVLISLTGNVGRVGIVFESNLLLNQRVAKIMPHNIETLPFIYYLFRQKEFKEYLENISKGTAQQNLSPVDTLKTKIIINENAIKLFSEIINPLFSKHISLFQQNQVLSALRDLLLPKLMSGEVRVPIGEMQ